MWNKNKEGDLYKAIEKEINAAVKKYEMVKPASPEDMFKYVYKELTPELKEEMESWKNG